MSKRSGFSDRTRAILSTVSSVLLAVGGAASLVPNDLPDKSVISFTLIVLGCVGFGLQAKGTPAAKRPDFLGMRNLAKTVRRKN